MSCDDVTMVSATEQVTHTNARRTKTFRSYHQDQMLLMPPSLDDWLPDDHIARFISEIVDECLDLGAIYGSYQQAAGAPPYDPAMMLMGHVRRSGVLPGFNRSKQHRLLHQIVEAHRGPLRECANRASFVVVH